MSKTKAATAKAATAKAATAKAATATEPKEVVELPEIRDAEGALKKLKRSNFPKSREGRLAFCDYMITKWTERKSAVDRATDPLSRKRKQRDRLLEKLAQLEAELEEASESEGEESEGEQSE